jgi:hypothetical protein
VLQPIRAEKALLKKVEKPQTTAASVTLADIEQKIEELEAQIHLLKQRMETGLDLEMLQKQFTELERLETEREHLYKQLDDVV